MENITRPIRGVKGKYNSSDFVPPAEYSKVASGRQRGSSSLPSCPEDEFSVCDDPNAMNAGCLPSSSLYEADTFEVGRRAISRKKGIRPGAKIGNRYSSFSTANTSTTISTSFESQSGIHETIMNDTSDRPIIQRVKSGESSMSLGSLRSLGRYFTKSGDESARLERSGIIRMMEDSADRMKLSVDGSSLELAADAILEQGQGSPDVEAQDSITKSQLRGIYKEGAKSLQGTEESEEDSTEDEQVFQRAKVGWRKRKLSIMWTFVYIALMVFLFTKTVNDVNAKTETIAIYGWAIAYARACAIVTNLNAALLLLPVSRFMITWFQSRRTLRRVLPFDGAIEAHKIFGWAFILFSLIHSVMHYFTFSSFATASADDIENCYGEDMAALIPKSPFDRLSFLLKHRVAITGFLMLICMAAAVAVLSCRRKNFNRFYYFHHLLVLTLILMCIHGTGSIIAPAQTYKWIAIPLFVYLAPRIYRELCGHRAIVTKVDTCGKVLALTLQQPIGWEKKQKAGMYAMLNIPAVSRFEWHPFTISSAPHQQHIKFHINSSGDWTKKATNLLANNFQANKGEVDITVRLEGPFGAPAQGSRDYGCVVLIGAGIGVTPMISTLCSLLHSPGRMKKVFFYWTVRDNSAFRLFNEEMEDLYEQDLEGRLEIRHFLTSAVDAREDDKGSVVFNLATEKVHEKTDVDIRLGHRTKKLMGIGRPDWHAELETIANAVKEMNEDRAGIFFCGPERMASQIDKTSQRISMNQNVHLSFSKEIF